MKESYRLVFRSQDREANSTYSNPVFNCQLPENLVRNGTNRKIKVYLEYFGGFIDNTAPFDAVLVKLRNFAINGSQTSGAGRFEPISTLGVADFIRKDTGNDYFLATRYLQESACLEYNSFQFNQGRIEFILEDLAGAQVTTPGSSDHQYYTIILGIKTDDDY